MTFIDYIEGPVMGSLWTRGPQRVWIFGDQHEITYTCPRSQKSTIRRLEHVIMDEASTAETIDVFLEYHRATLEPEEGHTTMTATVRTYMDLFQLALLGCWRQCSTSCYVRNLRLHSIDARKFKSAYLMIYESCHSLAYNTTKPTTKSGKRRVLEQLAPEILQALRDGVKTYMDGPDLRVKDLIEYHIRSSKAMKQVEKITDSRIRHVVVDRIVTRAFVKYRKVVQPKLDDILAWIDSLDARLFDFMHGFVDVGMIPMDLYAIGRLLSTFQDGSVVRRALFFVGWVHARLYENVLKALGYHRVWSSPRRRDGLPPSMSQYLDVRSAPQPFLA